MLNHFSIYFNTGIPILQIVCNSRHSCFNPAFAYKSSFIDKSSTLNVHILHISLQSTYIRAPEPFHIRNIGQFGDIVCFRSHRAWLGHTHGIRQECARPRAICLLPNGGGDFTDISAAFVSFTYRTQDSYTTQFDSSHQLRKKRTTVDNLRPSRACLLKPNWFTS